MLSRARKQAVRQQVSDSRSTPSSGASWSPFRNLLIQGASAVTRRERLYPANFFGFRAGLEPRVQSASIHFNPGAGSGYHGQDQVPESDAVSISGGCSSAGRAPDLHSGGRRFDPDQLHQIEAALAL